MLDDAYVAYTHPAHEDRAGTGRGNSRGPAGEWAPIDERLQRLRALMAQVRSQQAHERHRLAVHTNMQQQLEREMIWGNIIETIIYVVVMMSQGLFLQSLLGTSRRPGQGVAWA